MSCNHEDNEKTRILSTQFSPAVDRKLLLHVKPYSREQARSNDVALWQSQYPRYTLTTTG